MRGCFVRALAIVAASALCAPAPARAAAADPGEGSPDRRTVLNGGETAGPALTAQGLPPTATTGASGAAAGPLETVIVRTIVNGVLKGDAALLRSARGNWLVPWRTVAQWGLKVTDTARVAIRGEEFIDLGSVPDLQVNFDEKTVTLEVRAAAKLLPGTTIDLGWQRRPGTIYPADNSVLFNYSLTAVGDDNFGSRSYQAATELAARTGNWLFYNTTTVQHGQIYQNSVTRLVTNVQYDDRSTLRRFTVGDFFTPGLELTSSVSMGGFSLTKLYQMDPYFVQYPRAGFTTQVTLPSMVDVRVDGNLVAQRQVQPGPLDIANITAAAGQRNLTVTVRDPFGREQVIGQPFFFTQFGLAKGLHEYSYNAGFLRRQYGITSNDYGPLAAAAYHRYAFTDAVTLGVRGEADDRFVNFGPFGTLQLSRAGILGVGVSGSSSNAGTGYASGVSYSYAQGPLSLNFSGRHFSRDYVRLADSLNTFRLRLDGFANAALFLPEIGTVSAGYGTTRSYAAPDNTSWNLGYSRALFGTKGILSVNFTHTEAPASSNAWFVSLTYFLDREYSVVGRAGGARNSNFQTAALQKVIPRGEGYGYNLEAGRVENDSTAAAVGRANMQFNGTHATAGFDYTRASNRNVDPGFSRAFVAGSVGYVGGTVFTSRPVQDSFAVVKVGDVPDVPVYANGWLQGRTNASGEVVATDLNAFYDNYLNFRADNLPLNYQFPSSLQVISPPYRSGSLVTFQLRRAQAVYGVLVREQDGKRLPIELRELRVKGNGRAIDAFTARRGEFYIEDLEPGEYLLQIDKDPACTARISVPKTDQPMVDLGTVLCAPRAP